MKILVICQYYFPENFQINSICAELVQKGHEVTVLTGLPNYPSGVIPREYKHGGRREEWINGVHVLRCPEIGRKHGTVGLVLNYLSFSISASLRAIIGHFDFDVIYVYQLSPILMAMPAVFLRRKYKKPVFLYCCDLWPESMKLIFKNENSLVFKAIAKLSTYIYQKANKIAIQSASFFPYFEEQHGIKSEKICYIPQFGDDTYLNMDFSKSCEAQNCINFVFLGNIGLAQDMPCIFKAVKLLKNEKFLVHIVGDGSALDECKKLVEEYDISEHVLFYGRRPVEEMPQFYKLADACLLTLKDDSLIGYTIPSKLQGYMAAGKPVVAAINGSAQDIINESLCGLYVNASDYRGLANIMQQFMKNLNAYQSFGGNGRKYFSQHFTKDIHINAVEAELKRLVGEDNVSI